jgi:hypothetical protein
VKICDEIHASMTEGEYCEDFGSGVRFVTHVMYPSFEQVEVVISRYGSGFVVTDDGGAVHTAHLHGRDDISQVLEKQSHRFGVTCRDGVVTAKINGHEDLKAAILAVANASASAAHTALEKVSLSVDKRTREAVFQALGAVVGAKNITRNFKRSGVSGKNYKYDFMAAMGKEQLLLNIVVSNPISVAIMTTYLSALQFTTALWTQ